MTKLRTVTGLAKGPNALIIVSAVLIFVGVILGLLVAFGPSKPAPDDGNIYPLDQVSAVPMWVVLVAVGSVVVGGLLATLTLTLARRPYEPMQEEAN